MNVKAIRLPAFAERTFAAECSRHGALCHKAEEDENGWDYLVEFPAVPSTQYADQSPAPLNAYVQIKSATGGKMRCKVTLSNALNACKSPDPWFLVLISDCGNELRVYCKHFCEKEISRSLKRVRQAQNDNKSLNSLEISFSFKDSERHDGDLIEWMRLEIGELIADYRSKKMSVYKSVGYDGGWGHGVFTVSADSEREILLNFLGLGNGLNAQHIKMHMSRFGIDSTTPEIDADGGRIKITPHANGACKMILRNTDCSESLTLPAKIYGTGLPGRTIEQQHLRFETDLFDLIYPEIPGHNFQFSFAMDVRMPLDRLAQLARISKWGQQGSIDLQVWIEAKRALGLTLRLNIQQDEWLWEHVDHALVFLGEFLKNSQVDEGLYLSFSDLANSSSPLTNFHNHAKSPSLRFMAQLENPVKSQIDRLLYYSHLKIGPYLFCVLIERQFDSAHTEGVNINSNLGRPIWLEYYVLPSGAEDTPSLIQDDYQRYLQESGDNVLAIGNISGVLFDI